MNIEYPNSTPERRNAHTEGNWIKAPNGICPRCGGEVPVPGHRGEYLGARSRTDNLTEVCTRCGNEEAGEQMGGKLTPQDQWPIRRMSSWETARGLGSPAAILPAPMPQEVPELRLHLLDRWVPGGLFERAAAGAALFGTVQAYAAVERRNLGEASLWWIKDDMGQLIEAAMPSIPEDVCASEIELPEPNGLAVLQRPWIGHSSERTFAYEAGADPLRVDAVLWGTALDTPVPRITFSAYQYLDFAKGLGADELGRAVKSGAIFESHTEKVGPDSARLRGGAWCWLGRSDWPLSEPLSHVDHLRALGGATPEREASMVEDRRFLAAFVVLVTHRLMTETETHYAARPVRRRTERKGITVPSNVKIVRLRETERRRYTDAEDDDEHRHVEWSHRWIQSGHMGWRRCGPGSTQRRLVYVRPGIKGPKDKPLVIKERVNAWIK